MKNFRGPSRCGFLVVVSCQESSPVLHSRTEARSHCVRERARNSFTSEHYRVLFLGGAVREWASRKRVGVRGSQLELKAARCGGHFMVARARTPPASARAAAQPARALLKISSIIVIIISSYPIIFLTLHLHTLLSISTYALIKP